MNHWLVKQEPEDYSWSDFVRDGGTAWTGVRNFQARIHLRSMALGELVLFYHSGKDKMVVGVAKVARVAYPDPTAEEGSWSAVDLVPVRSMTVPVPLARIKADVRLMSIGLVRQPRLSVMPLEADQFKAIAELGQTRA